MVGNSSSPRMVRRVVTGVDARGTSGVMSDEEVPPVGLEAQPGTEFHWLWGSDATLPCPNSGELPACRGTLPPPGGFRFVEFTVAPGSEGLPRDEQLATEFPELADAHEGDAGGFHQTTSIGLVYVISGSVALAFDDDTETVLHAGDVVVQNGPRHAWRNRSSEPCRMLIVVIGADDAQRSGGAPSTADS